MGISPSTTAQDLTEYLEKFGKVTAAVVKICNNVSRGFGFVTFEHESSVEMVISEPFHVIADKCVEVKRARKLPTTERTVTFNEAKAQISVTTTPTSEQH